MPGEVLLPTVAAVYDGGHSPDGGDAAGVGHHPRGGRLYKFNPVVTHHSLKASRLFK